MTNVDRDLRLDPAEVAARREQPSLPLKVVFGVRALYGLSEDSVPFPVSATESVESGQICLTMDPDADPSANTGVIDFEQCSLVVRYGAVIVFPGLYELVMSRRYDMSLLNPIRAVATDHCTTTPDFSGWRALGCLEFLPGGLWSGAEGG
ncbi:MAG: hypothetical protein ACRDRX_24085 [Pseudonocardiaceae bacterium]